MSRHNNSSISVQFLYYIVWENWPYKIGQSPNVYHNSPRVSPPLRHLVFRYSHLSDLWSLYPRHSVSGIPSPRHPAQLVHSEISDLATKWVKLASNGTNPELFQIRFQYILKGTETWSEKVPDLSHLGPIWPTLGVKPTIPGQSSPKHWTVNVMVISARTRML